MNILSLFVLGSVYFTKNFDGKYHNIIYFKLFLVSFILFYYARSSNFILSVFFTLTSLILLIYLIYRYFVYSKISENNNILFQVAHEVKNPIAVCKGYLDMLDINNKDKVERYIPVVKKEMNRALSIMDEFLSTKRITLNKDLMDFSLLLDDIKETMSLVLDKNINLIIPSLDEELILDGDYDKLKQVVVNLIKNSYEAGAKNIKLVVKIKKNRLKLEIIDDGIGISKNDLERIGNIFYTTKVMGTGMGVAISKEILKLHSGELSYSSILNKGTIASVLLPLEYVL